MLSMVGVSSASVSVTSDISILIFPQVVFVLEKCLSKRLIQEL